MSKYICVVLLTAGILALPGGVKADEVRSTSTEVENPGASSSSTTTNTVEDKPTTVKQESTSTEVSPGGAKQTVTTRKYSAPKRQRTVTKHVETETTP